MIESLAKPLVKIIWVYSTLLLTTLLLVPSLLVAQTDNTGAKGTKLVGSPEISSLSQVSAYQDSDFFSQPEVVYGSDYRFEVFRNDKLVGEHTIAFSREGTLLVVSIKSALIIRYLGIPVYKYGYSSIERWQGEVFQSVFSEIRDNFKKPLQISAENKTRYLKILNDGERRSLEIAFPTNHWNPAVLKKSKVFHTLHGRIYDAEITDHGIETITLTSGEGSAELFEISARKYSYSGGFESMVWYDQRRRWVRLLFKADDGSEIDYRCTSCFSGEAKR